MSTACSTSSSASGGSIRGTQVRFSTTGSPGRFCPTMAEAYDSPKQSSMRPWASLRNVCTLPRPASIWSGSVCNSASSPATVTKYEGLPLRL